MLCYKLKLATRVAMVHGSRVAWLAGEHVDLHILVNLVRCIVVFASRCLV
jgi:hypothetical protein